MKRRIKCSKSVVFIETNRGPCIFALCYFYEMAFFIFNLLYSMPFAADKQHHAWPRPLLNHIARTSLQPGGNKNGLRAVFRSSFHFRQRLRKIKLKILRELRKHRLNCIAISLHLSIKERRSSWNNMARRERSIDVSKYIQFFLLSRNI